MTLSQAGLLYPAVLEFHHSQRRSIAQQPRRGERRLRQHPRVVQEGRDRLGRPPVMRINLRRALLFLVVCLQTAEMPSRQPLRPRRRR